MEETPRATTTNATDDAATESPLRHADELLPVPTGAPATKAPRGSFWRRITARRSVKRAHALTSEDPQDAIRGRLETIEGQLEVLEDALASRFDAMDARFNRLWEIEDQLDRVLEMRASVEAMERAQLESARAAGTLRRGVGWLAALILAVGAGLLAAILAR